MPRYNLRDKEKLIEDIVKNTPHPDETNMRLYLLLDEGYRCLKNSFNEQIDNILQGRQKPKDVNKALGMLNSWIRSTEAYHQKLTPGTVYSCYTDIIKKCSNPEQFININGNQERSYLFYSKRGFSPLFIDHICDEAEKLEDKLLLRCPTKAEFFKYPAKEFKDEQIDGGERAEINSAFRKYPAYVDGYGDQHVPNLFDLIDMTARGYMTVKAFNKINNGDPGYNNGFGIALDTNDWEIIHNRIRQKQIDPAIQVEIDKWEEEKRKPEPKYTDGRTPDLEDAGYPATPTSSSASSKHSNGDSPATRSDSGNSNSAPDSPSSPTIPNWKKKYHDMMSEHEEITREEEIKKLAEKEEERLKESPPPPSPSNSWGNTSADKSDEEVVEPDTDVQNAKKTKAMKKKSHCAIL